MHFGLCAAELKRIGRGDHDLGRRCDVRELRVHLGPYVFELQLVHRRPGPRVLGKDHVEQALNDALFRGREITPLDARVEASVAPEQVVDHQEDEVGVEDHQTRATQGFDLHQVEVGRHDQVAHELAVFLHLDRTDRNLRTAVHVVEQADAQVTGKALVDELHRRHSAADDAFLRGKVVRANAAFVLGATLRLVRFSRDAAQQGIYFILGEKVGHDRRSVTG